MNLVHSLLFSCADCPSRVRGAVGPSVWRRSRTSLWRTAVSWWVSVTLHINTHSQNRSSHRFHRVWEWALFSLFWNVALHLHEILMQYNTAAKLSFRNDHGVESTLSDTVSTKNEYDKAVLLDSSSINIPKLIHIHFYNHNWHFENRKYTYRVTACIIFRGCLSCSLVEMTASLK